jgi:hypothetical protein
VYYGGVVPGSDDELLLVRPGMEYPRSRAPAREGPLTLRDLREQTSPSTALRLAISEKLVDCTFNATRM